MAEDYCRQIYGEFVDKLESVKRELRDSASTTAAATMSPGGMMVRPESMYHDPSSGSSSPSVMINNPYNDQYHVVDGSMDRNKIATLARNKVLNDSRWIEAEKIYLTLFDVYLSPPPQHQKSGHKFMRQAQSMLRKNHERVDPIAVLNKFPRHIKVSETLKFMEAVLKSCFERKREFQVKKNLLKQAHLRLQMSKNRRESNFQRITNETKCSKCGKRIGDAAFVRYPNRTVFHYVCVRPHQYGGGAESSSMHGQNGSILHHLHRGMDDERSDSDRGDERGAVSFGLDRL